MDIEFRLEEAPPIGSYVEIRSDPFGAPAETHEMLWLKVIAVNDLAKKISGELEQDAVTVPHLRAGTLLYVSYADVTGYQAPSSIDKGELRTLDNSRGQDGEGLKVSGAKAVWNSPRSGYVRAPDITDPDLQKHGQFYGGAIDESEINALKPGPVFVRREPRLTLDMAKAIIGCAIGGAEFETRARQVAPPVDDRHSPVFVDDTLVRPKGWMSVSPIYLVDRDSLHPDKHSKSTFPLTPEGVGALIQYVWVYSRPSSAGAVGEGPPVVGAGDDATGD